MFLVVIEQEEAFSVTLASFLEFLDIKAAGGDRGLNRFGHSIGEAVTDVSQLTPMQALALAEKLRAEERVGMMRVVAAA